MSGSEGKFRRLARGFRENGIAGVLTLARAFERKRRNARAYKRFILRETLDDNRRQKLRDAARNLPHRPSFSVILPVYNIDERWLKKCVDSVRRQIYPNWELCIADDASTMPHIRPFLERLAAEEPRAKIIFRPENGHISAASNSALSVAAGDFCVLLDHDDELSEDALFYVAAELNAFPDAKMIFSDEDVIDTQGRRSDPKFKPAFSPGLMLSLNMVTHLSAYRTDILRELGGFRLGLEGSQDYDLALRVIEKISLTEIRHIPRILYHWRAVETSVASNRGAKPYAFEKARAAIKDHFERMNIDAQVAEAADGLNRVQYPLREMRVSIIAAGDGRMAEIEGRETIYAGGTSARELNAAAAKAKGDILVFLDLSLGPVTDDPVRELASFAAQEAIGVAGCKILRKDGAISQTGLILGGKETVRPAHYGYPANANGYFFRAGLIGNYSAVSWRAMAIRRELFESIGGFRADLFPRGLFDVDLCLRSMQAGKRVVYTPYAIFKETTEAFEKASESETAALRKLWPEEMLSDPHYNPNLAADGDAFDIEAA